MPFELQPCSNLPPFDLTRFLNGNNLSFNNLDWFSPEERFSEPGSFAILEDQQIKALLGATPESPSAAWLRFFYAERSGDYATYFKTLLSQARTTLLEMQAHSLFSLAPYPWLERLLRREGFTPADKIVTLQRNSAREKSSNSVQDVVIRQMTYRDMAAVEAIDTAAFIPAWQLNLASLVRTYHRSAAHSVALLEGEIVGYQMSTSTFDTAHLARLAVDPRWQRRGVGGKLFQDMLDSFSAIGVTSFSVNTQASNTQSLSLYHHFGYEHEDRDILVMALEL